MPQTDPEAIKRLVLMAAHSPDGFITKSDLTEEDVAREGVLADPVQTAQYAQRGQAPP